VEERDFSLVVDELELALNKLDALEQALRVPAPPPAIYPLNRELARVLGRDCVRSVKRDVAAGKLPAFEKVGGVVGYTPGTLDAIGETARRREQRT
jgi:hypothetical protein